MQIVEISDRSGGGQDYFAGSGLAAGAGGVAGAAGAGGGAEPEVVGAAGGAGAGRGCAGRLVPAAGDPRVRLAVTLGFTSEQNTARARKNGSARAPTEP